MIHADNVRAAIREAIAYDPTLLDDDCTPALELADAVHEHADGCVPVYNTELAQALADDLSLAEVDDPGILPENPTVWQIIQIALYERLSQAAHEHAEEIASYLEKFVPAYALALNWTEHDDQTVPDLPPDDQRALLDDCIRFVADNWIALHASCQYSADDAGHDFALTRNGHGTGFWDRDPLDRSVQDMRGFAPNEPRTQGQILTDACKRLPNANLLRDEDGELSYVAM